MIATIHRLSAPNTVFKDQHAYHVEREFVRVTGGSGLIENVSAVALGDTERPNLPTGIKFQDGGTDWTVRRARMSGFAMRPIEGRYRNGDGFSTELPNARIRFEACQGNGNGDAGFDLKGPDWHLDDCTAERNAHNFRFWSTGVAGRIRSVEPMVDGLARGRPLHVHICPAREHTDRQVIRIDSLFARGPGWLLFVETRPESPPPQIVIASHDVDGVTEVVRSTGPAPEIIWSSGAPKR